MLKNLLSILTLIFFITNFILSKDKNSFIIDTNKLQSGLSEFVKEMEFFNSFSSLNNAHVSIDSILGQKIDNFRNFKFDTTMIVVSSNEFGYNFIALIDSIKYEIGVKLKDHIINFISSVDTILILSPGIKIGTTLSVLKKMGFDNLIYEKGWGYYIKIPGNWYLGFNHKIKRGHIKESDKIIFFFKRL